MLLKNKAKFLICLILMAGCSGKLNSDQGPKTPNQNNQTPSVCTFELGYHRTVLYNDRSKPEQYKPLLDKIKASGARTVRLSVNGGVETQVMNHVLYCNKIGLPVTLMLGTNGLPQNCYEEGTKRSQFIEKYSFWSVYPISKIIPAKYDNWISNLLLMYKEAGCKLDAIEVGNEIMWCAFNADLPTTGGIIYDSTWNWNDIPEQIRESVKRSGEIAIVTKTACQKVYFENPPKVVFGSLNGGENVEYYRATGGCIMKPSTAMEIATAKYPGMPESSINYIEELDGIAIHLYPTNVPYSVNYETMVNGFKNYIATMMDGLVACTNKPVYVTEFGLRYSEDGKVSDYKRTERFRAFLEAMDQTQSKYHWKQAHIYSWDQGDFAVVDPDTGDLLDAGKNVIKNYYSQLR